MKYLISIITFFLATLSLQNCTIPTSESSSIKRLIISANQKDCDNGVARIKCLLVKEKPTDQWQFFYGNIEGFKYEEGYEYVLEVKTEKIENPPADASSIKYSLVRQVAKNKR